MSSKILRAVVFLAAVYGATLAIIDRDWSELGWIVNAALFWFFYIHEVDEFKQFRAFVAKHTR